MRYLSHLMATACLAFFASMTAAAQTADLPTLLQQLQQAVADAQPDTATADALEAEAADLQAQADDQKAQAQAALTNAAALEDEAAQKIADADAARQPDPVAQQAVKDIWQQVTELLGLSTTPVPQPVPGPTPEPVPTPEPTGLTAFSDADFGTVINVIAGHQDKQPIGNAFDASAVNVVDGSLVFDVDATRSGAIKWKAEKALMKTEGHYEVVAKISDPDPGVVYAPLWLYGEGGLDPKAEWDFEWMIRNGQPMLDVNYHYTGGSGNLVSVPANIAGHWVRWVIDRRTDKVKMQADCLDCAVPWSVDWTFTPADVTAKGFPWIANDAAMAPFAEAWACKYSAWCGTWAGGTSGMTLQGYAFTD